MHILILDCKLGAKRALMAPGTACCSRNQLQKPESEIAYIFIEHTGQVRKAFVVCGGEFSPFLQTFSLESRSGCKTLGTQENLGTWISPTNLNQQNIINELHG